MAGSVRRFKETLDMSSPLVRRIRSHRYFPMGAIAVVVLAVACMHIWQRVAVIQLVKDVAGLRAENHRLVDENKKVQSDIASLAMASRIERIGRDSLGLQPISPERLLTLVRSSEENLSPDELATMFSSIKRVAQYLPSLSQTQAAAAELRPLRFDTVVSEPAK